MELDLSLDQVHIIAIALLNEFQGVNASCTHTTMHGTKSCT